MLIYLEALAQGTPPPSYAAHLLPDMLDAAQRLAIASLQEACAGRLGALERRVRCWTPEEVRAANASGRCLLTMDGMVLDVTRWLPEHPGGSSIIPAQALNLDSCRFFEVRCCSTCAYTRNACRCIIRRGRAFCTWRSFT